MILAIAFFLTSIVAALSDHSILSLMLFVIALGYTVE